MYKYLFNNKFIKGRRKELRKNQTKAEEKLWELLRNKRFNGLKFNRQFSIGPYILDFYCPKLRLGIELDGDHHIEKENTILDKEREKILQASNVKIIRFWNSEVENNIENVLEKIRKENNSTNSTRLL